MNYAWVTLLSTKDFITPVLNLQYSLKRVNSKYPLIILVKDKIALEVIPMLEKNQCLYYVVPDLNRMSDTYEFSIDMLMKFYAFELIEYKKVCYLDGDMLILKNCDFIFNYRTPAAKFLGWTRPIQEHTGRQPGILAGEVMLIEPGTFSMDIFFSMSKDQLKSKHDERILQDHFPIQSITNLEISHEDAGGHKTHYIFHAHASGDKWKYWNKFNLYSETALNSFFDEHEDNLYAVLKGYEVNDNH